MTENNWNQHTSGKKHTQNLARQQSQTDSTERSIFVTAFPPNTTEVQLTAYFSQFAPIAKVTWDKNNDKFAFVEFGEKSAVATVLSQKHKLGNRSLVVREKRQRNIQPETPSTADSESIKLDETATEQQLVSEADVDGQIIFLLERFALSKEESETRTQICRVLEPLMRRFFPNCQVIPYGSCVNGLGMIDSDVDIFLDLAEAWDPAEAEFDESQRPMLQSVINQLEKYRTVEDPTFLNIVKNFTTKSMIELLSHIIRKYGRCCREVKPITAARCPIVKFYYTQSSLNSDLSILNGLVVHNTMLIKFYQELDPRVYPVLFAIRYWTKRKGLLDSQKKRFNSYTITMMSLFYLQNCKPPVLPTVETLQKLADDMTMCYGWSCHFCTDKSKIPPSENQDNLEKLFIGFFHFYWKLNMTDNVLCLRTGQLVSNSVFKDMIKADESLSNFAWKIFNIQDPFELDCNIATNFSDVAIAMWMQAINEVCEMSSVLWAKKSGTVWGLAALFAEDRIPAATVNIPNTAAVKPIVCAKELFEFNVIINMIAVKQMKGAKILTDDEYIQKTALIVRDVFKTALKFECEDLDLATAEVGDGDEEPLRKKVKVEEEDVALQMDRDMVKFSCRAYHRTWINRKIGRKAVLNGGSCDKADQANGSTHLRSIVAIEAQISEAIIKEAAAVAPQPLLQFICSVRPFKENSQIGATVQLCLFNVSKEFTAISSFLKSYVPKITNQMIVH